MFQINSGLQLLQDGSRAFTTSTSDDLHAHILTITTPTIQNRHKPLKPLKIQPYSYRNDFLQLLQFIVYCMYIYIEAMLKRFTIRYIPYSGFLDAGRVAWILPVPFSKC